MKLILVRHGETHLNKEGRILGINDAPLNATGKAQARAAASALARDAPFALYSSPVARALETARIISETLQVSYAPLKGLEEADAGRLDGLTGQQMREQFPDFVRRWADDASTAQMPGGESLLQVQERAWRAIVELMERHPDGTVIAVSHNFTNLAIVCKVLDTPLSQFRRLRQNLGSITRIELTKERSVLLSLNETNHLHSIGTD